MKRDKTGFYQHTLPDGSRAWVDDPNLPMRCIIQRATNRFQAYQRIESKFVSHGYCLSREDIKRYLKGYDADLYAEFGHHAAFNADLERERLVYPSGTLDLWLSSDASEA